MSTCYIYTDASERFGFRTYANVVLFENNHHWDVGECPATEPTTVYAEIGSLHRAIIRALTIAPEASLTAYTDLDSILHAVQTRRYKGKLRVAMNELCLLLDANPGVRVCSVPRQHSLYKECHNRARAMAKRLASRPRDAVCASPIRPVTPARDGNPGGAIPKPAKHPSPVPMQKLPNMCGFRKPVERIDVLQIMFDLGGVAATGTEQERAEALALLHEFKLKYPSLVGIYPRS